ncbi:T6SS effector amidase Tae4 family protein [Chryseobacterium sp. JK1]|uniref:T6SS effector amidase Tae4 family protein n=1 Tax=Chryseobacterium sp. JK1 TaxID=874294 RepID=UPI003D69F5A4
MNINNFTPILLEQRRGIVATTGSGQTRPVQIKRPSWKKVYEGYPRSGNNDKPANLVFSEILGDSYDKKIFGNACATRVSLGLINGGMTVKTAFRITNKKHAFFNKGFQTSVSGLYNWLSKKEIWGAADIKVTGPSDINTVANKINEGRIKNGVYIILGGFGDGISGHATLWIGSHRNVIGGHDYVSYGGTVYFWELK